ncbi:MAG TPA: serine hydrolase domain-containing protein [Nocardioidaceae bacterium]|nr:serine hydrolase domain-containing protein [Nocardioidaceae bacterium]
MEWVGSDDAIQQALAGVVDAAAEAERLPSLTVAVGFGRRPWWTREVGQVGRQYRVGSITKTFTAVLVMRLRDEGRLDLDDRVDAHLPDAPFGARTIRSLLAHSSGIPAEPAGPWWERSPGGSWRELVAGNAAREPVFRAHSRFHYSNLGFAVLGELGANLRGAPWWKCVLDEIVEPLGLSETTYLPLDGAAVGTSRNPLTGVLVGERVQETGAMAPAGQLWSTPRDLTAWADVLTHGWSAVVGMPQRIPIGTDLLTPDTAEEMRTVQAGDPDDQHQGGYGLGLRLHWSPNGTLVGHTGSMPGFLAAMFADPKTHVSAVVMTNATTGLDTEQLATDLIARLQPMGYHRTGLEDEPDPEDAMPDLVGDWFWGNTRFTLAAVIDGLTLVSGREDVWRFLRVDIDGYRGLTGYVAGEHLTVHRRPDGAPAWLEVATFILTRQPYDPAAPIPGGSPIDWDGGIS